MVDSSLRGVYPFASLRAGSERREILPGAGPEREQILRFAQNDWRRAQSDTERRAQNDTPSLTGDALVADNGGDGRPSRTGDRHPGGPAAGGRPHGRPGAPDGRKGGPAGGAGGGARAGPTAGDGRATARDDEEPPLHLGPHPHLL